MDRMEIGGIATEDNRAGMRAQGYIDRGVSRSPTRVFDPAVDISGESTVETTTVSTASKGAVTVYRDRVERSGEGREADALGEGGFLGHARGSLFGPRGW